MAVIHEAQAAQFRKQADWCEVLGSPFNAALLRGFADQIGHCGALDRLLSAFDNAGPAAAAHLRIAGALHALALSGRDRALEAEYPAARPEWDMADVLPAAIAALQTHEDWVTLFIRDTPQTNETRRAIALLPGFCALSGHGPLHLREIGASAGLNQYWDCFNYRGADWALEGDARAPMIETDWQGAAPDLPRRFVVGSRLACDQTPIDLTRASERLRLKAYVWPDQAERLARLEAAIALSERREVNVAQADVCDWLEALLEEPLPLGTTVFYHSIVWSYFPPETAARAQALIEAMGERADWAHRVAWLRFEHEKVFGGAGDGFAVDLVTWPGGERRQIAEADPHARWVKPV